MKRFGLFFIGYLALFFVLTYPSGWGCFSGFLGDEGDGLQNLWNIWWVKYALFDLPTNPLFTRYIFFPGGASLLGHTISLTNTVPSAVLALAVEPAVAYNVWLILGFVLGGVVVGYLFLEFGNGWLGAFVAGFVYTFSEYHFAHATGHFQLIAVEWLPLFLLMWMRLSVRPSAVRGLMAAVAFLLVFFADYYYALFSVMAGAGALFFRGANLRDRKLWLGLGVFTAVVVVAAGPVALATTEFLRPGLTASHNPSEFGADLLSPFVPGASWKFAEWTKAGLVDIQSAGG